MDSTAENLQLWEQRIEERIQAGMTIGEWCKKNGMSKYQYYYWNRRVHKKEKATRETGFAEITPILSSVNTARQDPAHITDFQIFFKSIRVIVPSEFNPIALTELMKVLQKL